MRSTILGIKGNKVIDLTRVCAGIELLMDVCSVDNVYLEHTLSL